MKIEVGKFYMCANGEIIEIIRVKNNIFYDNSGQPLYHEDGRLNKGSESEYDLIAEIPKELHQHLIKEVMNYWQDEDFRKTVDNVYGGEK